MVILIIMSKAGAQQDSTREVAVSEVERGTVTQSEAGFHFTIMLATSLNPSSLS